jgi:hypothetical protein
MPRPKKIEPIETSQPSPSLSEEADDPIAQNERVALDALLAELSGVSNCRVTVYRANRNMPQAYMFACSPEAFSLDDLRDKFNGGEFRAYISRDGKPWKNIKLTVEPKAPAATEPPPSTLDLAMLIRESFTQQAEMLRESLRAAVPPPANPFTGLNLPELITAISSAIVALRPPPSPIPPPPPPQPAIESKAIDMLLKGVELARELQSNGEEPGLMALARDFIRSPLLQAAVQATQTQSAAPMQPMPRISTPAPAPSKPAPAVTTSTQLASSNEGEMVNLQPYLVMLARKAAEGSDPTLYADLILDNVPEELLRTLLTRPPDAVSALVADYPPLAAHRDWMAQVIAVLQESLALDSSPEVVLNAQHVSTHSVNVSGSPTPVVSGDAAKSRS